MDVAISKNELKLIIQESVQYSLKKEMAKIRALITPFVCDQEQKEIEKLYHQPSRKKVKTANIEI